MANRKTDKCWIGVDLGGTKILSVVYNSKFKRIAQCRKKTKAYEGRKAGLDRLADTISTAMEEVGLSTKKLAGIGVGVPGPVNALSGTVLSMPNLGWRSVPLAAILRKQFKCPVVLSNDVDAGTYAEYKVGSASGARCVVGVFPGTGIGGGCVYEGRIVRGTGTSAFEMGHCKVVSEGAVCGCGRRGCLETVASRLAIASAAAAAAYRGEAPNLLKACGLDLSNIRSGALAQSIKSGDKAIEEIVRQAAYWLGVGVSYSVNLLAPDVVVLGGGLVEAMPALYIKEVARSAREHTIPALSKCFKVVPAKLGDSATALGAALWAREVALSKH